MCSGTDRCWRHATIGKMADMKHAPSQAPTKTLMTGLSPNQHLHDCTNTIIDSGVEIRALQKGSYFELGSNVGLNSHGCEGVFTPALPRRRTSHVLYVGAPRSQLLYCSGKTSSTMDVARLTSGS